MRKVSINLVSVPDRSTIHDKLQEKLELPDYYGRNLDALHDCLTEISEDTCIGLYEPGEISQIGSYIKLMNQVFQQAEEENPHLCVFIFQKEMKFVEMYR